MGCWLSTGNPVQFALTAGALEMASCIATPLRIDLESVTDMPMEAHHAFTVHKPCEVSNSLGGSQDDVLSTKKSLEMCSAVGKWAEGTSGALKTSKEQCVHNFGG